MGVQVPCRVHTKVPQEGAVWANPVPFLNLAFLAPGEFVEYGSQVLPNLPKQHLIAVIWCEHDMVLALSCRMVQVVVTL